jgi:preprotein translocase subunit SecD
LTELNVSSAKVVEVMGGFALQIEFNHSGNMLLEQYTAANPGRHLAVFSLFGKKKEESRWLGAPIIAHRISNGILIFTPDASRDEAERIAAGLNNYAKKSLEKSKW